MTALSVRIEDHSQRIMELLERKLRAGLGAAAEDLADAYAFGLQREPAPPHSERGEIPHAYLGHKSGGFGPVFGPGEPNNQPASGFSSTQTDFLSSYIRGTAGAPGQSLRGMVGFADSHVTRRSQNYLLMHDQNGRPWVNELFKPARQQMAAAFVRAFEDTP